MGSVAMKQLVKSKMPLAMLGLRRDARTGWLVHRYRGRDVFLKDRRNLWQPHYADNLCERLYYRHYRPEPGHVVVDFGAGFGYEAVWLAGACEDLRWIGCEIQPSVFECLSLTIAALGAGYAAWPLPIGEEGARLTIDPTVKSTDATTLGQRGVTLPCAGPERFLSHFGIDRIDFLKMNVEGAETALLGMLDLSRVGEVAISCHDFLADAGRSPAFRTFDDVQALLHAAGFETRPGQGKGAARRYWIYGRRNGFERD